MFRWRLDSHHHHHHHRLIIIIIICNLHENKSHKCHEVSNVFKNILSRQAKLREIFLALSKCVLVVSLRTFVIYKTGNRDIALKLILKSMIVWT